MKTFFYLIALVSISLGLFSKSAYCSNPSPLAYLEDNLKDFGKVFQGDSVSHSFVIQNKGDAVLKINKIIPACGCTVAVMTSKEIAPGASALVKTTFDTEGFRGLKEKKISVYTNDSKNTTLILSLKAEIVTDIWTQPSRILFSDISKGNSSKKSFLVLSNKKDKIKIKSIRSRSPHLDVSSEDYKDGSLVGKKVSVVINKEHAIPLGNFRSRVSVSTTSKKEPLINIPVLASIYGDMELSVKSVNFGVIKSSEINTVTKEVLFTNTSKKPIEILKIKNKNESVTLKKEVIKPGFKYRIKVGLKAPIKGIVQSRIIIKTDNKDPLQSELQLPIYAIIDS